MSECEEIRIISIDQERHASARSQQITIPDPLQVFAFNGTAIAHIINGDQAGGGIDDRD